MKLYEADFYRWTQDTSEHLKRGEFTDIDVAALVDEVEDLGRRQKSALQSRLTVLIIHLLKWDIQRARRSRSWQAAIELQRKRVKRLLDQSPSLHPFLVATLPDVYADAVLGAVKETGLDRKRFAESCPYTLDEILSNKSISLQ
jgi:hypothetical protein